MEMDTTETAPPRSAPVSEARGRRWQRFRNSDLAPALVFLSPWIIGFIWFQVYPICAAIYYSLTAYNLMRPPKFIGLANYQQLFGNDPLFRQALVHSAIYALISVPLDLFVAFCFACLLNLKIPGRAIFRAAFSFPVVVPTVATSILWVMLLNTQGGLVNVALSVFHIPAIPWLTSPNWTMPALILLSVWTIGPPIIIFLAGLQDVPKELYEVATIDGAGPLGLVRHVTIPLISPVILFNLVIGVIAAGQIFAQPLVIFSTTVSNTGSADIGGPLNSVLMYSVQLYYEAFQQFNMGYAAAMAWILFAILAIFSVVAMRLSNRIVHYE
jgi:multiple sugar transport system permease protein